EAIERADRRIALLVGDRIVAHLSAEEAGVLAKVTASVTLDSNIRPELAKVEAVVEQVERRAVKLRAVKKAASPAEPIGAGEAPRQKRKYTRGNDGRGPVALSERPILEDLEETRRLRKPIQLAPAAGDD